MNAAHARGAGIEPEAAAEEFAQDFNELLVQGNSSAHDLYDTRDERPVFQLSRIHTVRLIDLTIGQTMRDFATELTRILPKAGHFVAQTRPELERKYLS